MSECPADHKHALSGTCYVVHKCRCSDCREGQRARASQRRKLQAYGRYDRGLVDAAPVRSHILELRAYGLGLRQLAKVSGVNQAIIRSFIYGREDYKDGAYGPRHGLPRKWVSRENARKILAVTAEPGNLGERRTIDARPTARRIQALVAAGWSLSKLAKLLGVDPTNFGRVLVEKRVRSTTAVKVAALYDRISNTQPPADSWRDRIAVARSIRLGRERGWALPMDWEAYDNDFQRKVRRSA